MGTLNEDLNSIKTVEDTITNNKVANFAYTDYAYNHNDANGVNTYNVNQEQNIPVATAQALNVNETVLSKGWRSQASSITRMLLNHFLGRLSYNLNKVNDNMSSLLATFISHLGQANGIATLDANGRIPYAQLPESAIEYEGNWDASTNTPHLENGVGDKGDFYICNVAGTANFGAGDITFLENDRAIYDGAIWTKLSAGDVRTVNGNSPDPATGNVAITKSDVGLSSVVNTGDSANASSGGTTKFTTGGAYNLLTSLAPLFNTSTAYAVGDIVTYQNCLYECTTAHSAGAWNSSHFTARSVEYLLSTYILPSFAPVFNTSTAYAVGQFVIYQNCLYECITAHSAGAWDGSHFALANINKVTTDTDSKLALKADLLDLAPAFSTSTSYAVGDYIIYNGSMYRCTVAHSGAWNASDFTLVTVGSDLALKADKTSLALPTDAVLHYSFDEVPDYPDGTAIYYKNKNWTTTDGWYAFSYNGTISIENGILTSTRDDSHLSSFERVFSAIPANTILKMRLMDTSDTDVIIFAFSRDYTSIKTVSLKANIPSEVAISIANASTKIMLRNSSVIGTGKLQILSIYIGDGSYTTPIIDNANGQNNATNNGGIAVQGVSGKGAYFLEGKYAQVSNFNFANNFSISVWVKPDNADNNLFGNILFKSNVLYIRNGGSSNNYFHVAIYNPNTSSWQYITMEELLPINKYTHIVLVKNGTNVKLYYDTSLKKDSTIVDDVNTNNQPLNISNSNNTRPQTLDDLLIFDRALSETEVMALYLNKANTPKYYGEVPVTRKINGHTLEEDVTVTKADVELGNVVDTGDSATPVSGGTTKFTTGGAYSFFGENTSPSVWLGKVFGWALGKNWAQGTGSMTNCIFYSVYYANGIWVGCSSHGLWWSTDGKSWAQGTGSMTDYSFYSVYYANGIWVGSGNHGLWWSTDGKSWEQGAGSMTSYVFRSVYYANSIWVAGSIDHGLWWSTDGKSWEQGAGSMANYSFNTVYYANSIWVGGSSHGLWWSTDGKSWEQGAGSMTNYIFNTVYYANGIWVGGSSHGLWWSTDGKSWAQGTGSMTNYIFNTVYYANGIWVAGSTSYGLWWSADGKAWERVTGVTIGFEFNSVYYANGIWVAGSTSYGLWWSADGKAWEQGASSTRNDSSFLVYYANGIWVAGVGSTGLHYSDYTNAGLQ